MAKDKFYIYHQSFLNPLQTEVERMGYSVEQLVYNSYLKHFDIKNPDAYIPLKAVYEFLGLVERELSISNLVEAFYTNFEFKNLGTYGSRIVGCPDILSAINSGIKYQHSFQTNIEMQFDVHGEYARFSHAQLDSISSHRQRAHKIAFAIVIRAFKTLLGEDWKPDIIQVPGRETEWLEKLMDNGSEDRIVWQTHCSSFALLFKTDSLPEMNVAIKSHTVEKDVPDSSFAHRMRGLLKGYRQGIIPALADFADYFNVSERTIIRALKSEGYSFTKIMEEFLFGRSIELMRDESLSVNEISQILGYANPPNFLRAFKKWTNLTPHTYREQSIKIR